MKKSILALTLILRLSFSAFAQQPTPTPAPPPGTGPQKPEASQPERQSDDEVVRITTNLVQVDAVVTDSKGKPVTDLRAEEVEISEDGRQQKITNFSLVALDSIERPETKGIDKNVPPTPPVPLRPDQVRRTIALVVDDLGLSFESTNYVRQALKKFVDQQMQPTDLVAIIRTGGGIGALQQFTSDKRQLYAAVEKVKWNPNGRGHIGAFAALAVDPLRAEAGNAPAGATRRAPEPANEDIEQFREDLFAVGTLGALNYIVRGLRELPGRKSAVLISDGIPIFNMGDPFAGSRVLTSLRRLTDLANRASVVIYTIDARGLQVLGLTAADSTSGITPDQLERQLGDRRSAFFESQNGLNYLAQQTGGLAIRNNNDLSRGIGRVLEDQKSYYLIGYRPEDSTFESVSGRRKFHKLSLKINRPGKYSVRMRSGFFGITDEEAVPGPRTPRQQLLAALTSPFSSAEVNLRLTCLFANDQNVGSVMRSLMHIRARDLTFVAEPDGWFKAEFDVIAITFGDNGVVVDQISKTHTVRARGETYERILKDGFVYHLTVPIKKPGAYQLRTALRDEGSSRIGSASQFVEVPDIKKNRLVVSGIVVRGLSPAGYRKQQSGLMNQESSSPDQSDEVDAAASAAVRQFSRGQVMEVAFFIYNSRVDKASGKPNLKSQMLVFRNGERIFTGNEVPVSLLDQPDLKRLGVAGGIQLGTEMLPGEYALQIIVTDVLAKEKQRVASQWIDFEIIK